MSDDPSRWLFLSAAQFTAMVNPETGDVLVRWPLDPVSSDFAGHLGLVLRMTPNEARAIADLLRRKADEAEAVLSQH